MEAAAKSIASAFDSGDESQICSRLQEFNKENAQTFSFGALKSEMKKKLIGDIICKLEEHSGDECKRLCLETVRILSRDKYRLLQLQEQDCVLLVMKLAGLTDEDYDIDSLIEAQKCLCNLIFNSQSVQVICSNTDCVQHILNRTNISIGAELDHEIRYYDLRLLFLITAFCSNTRSRARVEYNAINVLTNALHRDVLQNCTAEGADITSKQLDLAVEVLKCLFNITIDATDDMELNEENERTLIQLGNAIRMLLLATGPTEDEIEKLHSHLANFLTVFLPKVCIKQLIPDSEAGACGGASVYMGRSMECVDIILKFMENRLDKVEKNNRLSGLELISPALTALCAVSKTECLIRKYLKEKVLPPLNVTICSSLPEEGNALRNRLVRFMTSPNTNVKEIVAEFLFILCKENPGRLVKYTGYGNAAGLLARRGLMTLGKGHGDYSSDEDSDTEAYTQIVDKINPITGRVEDCKSNPLDGMSDEQKEYEAHKLAQMFDRLSREGIFKAMMVGADGKMVPLEESFNQMPISPEHSDSEDNNT